MDLEADATAYAEVAVRGDVQRRGGARERRGSVSHSTGAEKDRMRKLVAELESER